MCHLVDRFHNQCSATSRGVCKLAALRSRVNVDSTLLICFGSRRNANRCSKLMFAARFVRFCFTTHSHSVRSYILLAQYKPVSVRWTPLAKFFSKMSTNSAGNNTKKVSSALSQISSRIQVSIVGNGANANPVAIVVTNDRETLLFNCGEGVQRLVFEHK